MARACDICGKTVSVGNRIVRHGLAKSKGGIGLHTTGITKRQFRPNLQKIRCRKRRERAQDGLHGVHSFEEDHESISASKRNGVGTGRQLPVPLCFWFPCFSAASSSMSPRITSGSSTAASRPCAAGC